MEYRPHEGGPLVKVTIEPGMVIVTMTFDTPGAFTRLHKHTFPHWLHMISGSARVKLGDVETIVRAGDRYLVEAGVHHGVWPLESGTVARCEHEHADIHPDKAGDGIPLEWLSRLTEHPEIVDKPEMFAL